MTAISPLGDKLSKRVQTWLGTRRIWNLELAGYAALFYTITAVSFDALRLNSFDPRWLAVWTGTYLEAIVLVAVLVLALPRRLWGNVGRGAFTNLVIAAAVGSTKNTTVYVWASALGLETDPFNPLIRLFGGATLAVGIVWSWVALSASRVGHKALMTTLHEKRDELLGLREGVGAQVTAAQTELMEQTKRTLLPKLQAMEANLAMSADAQDLVSELHNLIEQDVRPLSLAFLHEAETLAATAKPRPLDREVRRVFPPRFRLRENLPSLSALLFLFPLNYLTGFMLLDQEDALVIAISGFATIGALLSWRTLAPRNKEYTRPAGLAVLSFGSALAAVPQAFIVAWYMREAPDLEPLLITSLVGQTALGVWITAYLKILDESRISLEQKMVQLNAQLKHELSIFNQSLWLQKRRWSYLLHGSVQATLTAAIARLSSLSSSKLEGSQRATEAGMIIELVRQDLRRIASIITDPPQPKIDLMHELSQLKQTWHGVLDINFSVSERAMRAIEKSENTRLALNEICRESATNAFRHGQARALGIKIERVDENELLLTIKNDGTRVHAASRGLGSQMLDALTVEWGWAERKTTAQNVLTARLPIALV